MKKNVKRTIGLLLFIAAVLVICYALQLIVMNDGGNEGLNLQGFYLEEPDSLDAAIMGASEVMNGYNAAEVYKSSGYTSYPYAFSVNSVSLWKYELEEIERTQHPQVLFIETNGAVYSEDEYADQPHCIRLLSENMQMSGNRLDLALEKSEHPLEALFPIIKYHYKWSEANGEPAKNRLMLYSDDYCRLRGTKTPLHRDRIPMDELHEADDKTAELNPIAEKELREFLAVCRESEIPHIVFVEFPHILNNDENYERRMRANRAAQIIKEEGFDYIDFTAMTDEIGLDYETDFYDAHHLIAPGQRKLSDYIGRLLSERYGIEPRVQSKKSSERWEESAALIDKFYKYYDDYTAAHSDDPYADPDFVLRNDRRSIKAIEEGYRE